MFAAASVSIAACGGRLYPAADSPLSASANKPNAVTYRTLDNAADPAFNQLLGINDKGVIAGSYGSGASGHPNKGYVLEPPYAQTNFVDENYPGNKRARYFMGTRDGKVLLRRMMARHLPAAITEREKQGFSAPDGSWFKGESIDYVRRKLYGKHVRIYDYLDRKTVHALVEDHLAGRENRRLLIWSLLNLEVWCETFL